MMEHSNGYAGVGVRWVGGAGLPLVFDGEEARAVKSSVRRLCEEELVFIGI